MTKHWLNKRDKNVWKQYARDVFDIAIFNIVVIYFGGGTVIKKLVGIVT